MATIIVVALIANIVAAPIVLFTFGVAILAREKLVRDASTPRAAYLCARRGI